MNNILTISKREVSRLRSRFKGSSRPVLLLVLAGSFLISYLAFWQGAVLGKGIYRVGVSPDGPYIQDSRFDMIVIARSPGYSMLADQMIDVYIDGDQVAYRDEPRSLYAAGALRIYLEKQELARIKEEHAVYGLDRAFPLRIEVNYLPAPGADAWTALTGQGTSFAELIDELTSGPLETAGVDSGADQPSPDAPQLWPQSQPVPSETDSAVLERIRETEGGGRRPGIEMEFASGKEIIVPSLMSPSIPFAQVVVAFLYVLPISFVSVFFTSSFMDEKIDRRITILLSAPLTTFEIIAGKMLPYLSFSLASVVIMIIALRGNLLLAMAIFIPVILFIFSIHHAGKNAKAIPK